MNICISTSSFPVNHDAVYHRYIEDVINILHQNGHSVTILTQNISGEKEEFIPHAEVVWFPWKMPKQEMLLEVSANIIRNIFSVISLLFNGVRYTNKIACEKKIDAFICLWIVPSGLYVFLNNLLFPKTPYILWALGSDVYNYKGNFHTRLLLRFIIRNSKAVFADGFELCDIIHKISDRECQFLPTLHKLNVLETSLVCDKTDKHKVHFLCVGTLTHVKGIDILIESFKLLKSANSNLTFICHIIGEGSMMQILSKEINQNNLGEEILLIGKIMDDKKFAGYFTQADCIIIPSRSESIPIVLCEAIQFGKPVITTNAGDMEFIVKKYKLGLVAKKENPESLAEAIKKFIDHPLYISPADQKNALDILLFENSAQKLLNTVQCSQ